MKRKAQLIYGNICGKLYDGNYTHYICRYDDNNLFGVYDSNYNFQGVSGDFTEFNCCLFSNNFTFKKISNELLSSKLHNNNFTFIFYRYRNGILENNNIHHMTINDFVISYVLIDGKSYFIDVYKEYIAEKTTLNFILNDLIYFYNYFINDIKKKRKTDWASLWISSNSFVLGNGYLCGFTLYKEVEKNDDDDYGDVIIPFFNYKNGEVHGPFSNTHPTVSSIILKNILEKSLFNKDFVNFIEKTI